MVLSGRVYDGAKHASIYGAVISVIDKDGKPLGLQTTTNEVGAFYISSPLITLDSRLVIEHPRFFSKELSTSGSTSYGLISLNEIPAIEPIIPPLPDPGIVAHGNKPISSYWWILVLLGFAFWPDSSLRGNRSKQTNR